MTEIKYIDDPLIEFVRPIFYNTQTVKNGLDMYDGIAMHALKINDAGFGHFFSLSQQFSLDAAVIGICKLFDTSNSQYEKHTVPKLYERFEANFRQEYAHRLRADSLIALGINAKDANAIIAEANSGTFSNKTFVDLMRSLKQNMPSSSNNAGLKKLITYRNKIGAHQERLTAELREELAYLPALEEMENMNKWAENFCQFVLRILGGAGIVPAVTSAKMAALNMVAKILGMKFDEPGYLDKPENVILWDRFYRRSDNGD